jgi:hypothetical protein
MMDSPSVPIEMPSAQVITRPYLECVHATLKSLNIAQEWTTVIGDFLLRHTDEDSWIPNESEEYKTLDAAVSGFMESVPKDAQLREAFDYHCNHYALYLDWKSSLGARTDMSQITVEDIERLVSAAEHTEKGWSQQDTATTQQLREDESETDSRINRAPETSPKDLQGGPIKPDT